MKNITSSIQSQLDGEVVFKIFFVNPSYNPIDENDYSIAKLNIDESVVSMLKNTTSELMSNMSEKKQISIMEIEKEDDEYIVTVPLTDIDKLKEYINMIKNDQYTAFNAHDCEEFLKKLKFYIVQIKINEEEYYLIKRYSVNKLVTPKKVYLVCKENTFEHLKDEKILVLDSNYDALVHNEIVFMINDKQFSLLTGYYEKEKVQATAILNSIDQVGIIKDFEKLKEYCSERISYIKRLSKVDGNVLKKLNFKKIEELKKRRNVDFVIDKKSNTVSFENAEQLKNVVDLILDNFLVSELTNEAYRALNKLRESKTN